MNNFFFYFINAQLVRNKNFIRKYFRIISIYGLPGIVASGIRIKCKNISDLKTDSEGYVGVEDIIYHIIRCGLIHECELDNRIQFIDETRIGDFDKYFQLPRQIIWGLIFAVVLSEHNLSENCTENLKLIIDGQEFGLNELWGQEKKYIKTSR